jgi:hypothetical protein
MIHEVSFGEIQSSFGTFDTDLALELSDCLVEDEVGKFRF